MAASLPRQRYRNDAPENISRKVALLHDKEVEIVELELKLTTLRQEKERLEEELRLLKRADETIGLPEDQA